MTAPVRRSIGGEKGRHAAVALLPLRRLSGIVTRADDGRAELGVEWGDSVVFHPATKYFLVGRQDICRLQPWFQSRKMFRAQRRSV